MEMPFEERVLAALCHISVVMYFMGPILPGVIWVTQKDKSKYLKFQALQATIFQLLLILIFMGGMVLYFLSFILVIGLGVGSSIIGSGAEKVTGLSFVIPFAIMGVIFIMWPLFVIYGIYGAYSTYKGRDFRYKLLGDKLAEKLKT